MRDRRLLTQIVVANLLLIVAPVTTAPLAAAISKALSPAAGISPDAVSRSSTTSANCCRSALNRRSASPMMAAKAMTSPMRPAITPKSVASTVAACVVIIGEPSALQSLSTKVSWLSAAPVRFVKPEKLTVPGPSYLLHVGLSTGGLFGTQLSVATPVNVVGSPDRRHFEQYVRFTAHRNPRHLAVDLEQLRGFAEEPRARPVTRDLRAGGRREQRLLRAATRRLDRTKGGFEVVGPEVHVDAAARRRGVTSGGVEPADHRAVPGSPRDLFLFTERPNLPPRYNIAPTQEAPVVTGEGGVRRLRSMRWGLVPFWAKDLSIGNRLINARAEGAAATPAFRAAFARRRCLVPASLFCEPNGDVKPATWHWFAIKGTEPRPLFAFPGIWRRYRGPVKKDGPTSISRPMRS